MFVKTCHKQTIETGITFETRTFVFFETRTYSSICGPARKRPFETKIDLNNNRIFLIRHLNGIRKK